ncbi:MAG: bile acid:sodium symporter [Candidatus Marinimicrobia bacterium]|nr:bile acid:sodium symporter [Candidatus Neomarinimicrobiota bacterium]|tara:strand:+ start:586 stop:1440 length:855 start_codon:yes stop_codon:yes gene_type:complete
MIIDIILPLSLIFIMFSLGLGLKVQDFKNIMNNPKAFIIGIVNQMIVLPIMAFFIVIIFNLPSNLAVGIMILSCCPGGVTSNILTKLAKGDTALSISCTAVASLLTVITLPVIVGFSVTYFMGNNAPPINIILLGMTMFVISTMPVLLGLYINTKFANISNSFTPISNKISSFLFIIIVIGALASEWTLFIDNVHSLGPAIISLICIMMLVGYNSSKLFGIVDRQASTISIESGIQNGTVGIAIGNIILSTPEGLSVFSLPSGVYSILMYLVCLPAIFLFLKQK